MKDRPPPVSRCCGFLCGFGSVEKESVALQQLQTVLLEGLACSQMARSDNGDMCVICFFMPSMVWWYAVITGHFPLYFKAVLECLRENPLWSFLCLWCICGFFSCDFYPEDKPGVILSKRHKTRKYCRQSER